MRISDWSSYVCSSDLRRDDVQIATKVGLGMPGGRGLSARWIEQGVEDSLRRLRTDYIDLYYAHSDDPDTALEETLAAFDWLVRAGKVRAIAASNIAGARLSAALDLSEENGLARYGALQPWFNLVDRSEERRAGKGGVRTGRYRW